MNTAQSLINGFFEARSPEGLKASVRAELLTLTVARMKEEIVDDVADERVDITVGSFSELHDDVDANEYGGFCDDELSDLFIQFFGGRDQHEGMPDAYLDFMNEAQNAVDAWLKEVAVCQLMEDLVAALIESRGLRAEEDHALPTVG